MSRRRRFTYLLCAIALLSVILDGAAMPGGWGSAARGAAVAEAGYGRIPLAFVANGGQADAWASHVLPGDTASVLFGAEGLSFRLWQLPATPACGRRLADEVCRPALERPQPPDPLAKLAPGQRAGAPDRGTVDALGLTFVGGRDGLAAEAGAPQQTRVSYLRGPRERWLRGLPTFGELRYREVWPGVDLVFEAGSDRLKHRFELAPGADPARIRLAWQGATALGVAPDGSLVVDAAAGRLVDEAPIAYQERAGRRVPITVHYRLDGPADDGSRAYSFTLGDYDPTVGLIIDPATVVYASFLGTAGDDRGLGIELDDQRYAYLTGEQGPDAFVAKISPDGTQLVYLTVVGGDGTDAGFDIDVDAAGSAYFTGSTDSREDSFPVQRGPDLTYGGGALDGYVAKLSPDGSDLVYAGYIGGAGVDFGEALVVDELGAAYTSGDVESTEATFPVVVGPDLTQNGGVDAYVVKVKPEPYAAEPTANFAWAGFVGGRGHDVAVGEFSWSAGHLAIDRDHNVYISNETNSDEQSFPDGDGFGDLPGPDRTFNGVWDAYVAKIRADGTGLVYAGYIGGADRDQGKGMAVDHTGAAYLTGNTWSDEASFPVRLGPNLHYSGRADGFVAKVQPDGRGLAYCGYFGGDDDDSGQAVALGPDEALYVTGWSESTEATFPVVVGPDLTHNGPYEGGDESAEFDTIVGRLRLDPSAADPRENWDFLGYLGGSEPDAGFWLDVDGAGDAYIAGDTFSDGTTFPDGDGIGAIPGIGQPQHGERDAFIAKVAWRPLDTGRWAFLPFTGRGADRPAAPPTSAATASATAEPIATRTPTPGPTPTRLAPEPVTLRPGEELVFYDDFADPHSGWPTVDEEARHLGYVDGTLELDVDEADDWIEAAAPMERMGDGAVEVTAQMMAASNGFYAILFGPNMITGFILAIYPSGAFGLFQRHGNGFRTLIRATAAPAILTGLSPNRIRLERDGERVTILANGTVLASLQHPDLDEQGVVKLLIQANTDGGMVVRFDDFLVTRWAPDHATPTPPASATPLPTLVFPTAGPTVTRVAGQILFEDDFSDPSSGWLIEDVAEDRMGYVSGEYEILVRDTEIFIAALAPRIICADCTVEASARFDNAVFGILGLVLGEADPSSAVLLEITSDGRYAVERLHDNRLETMVDATRSSALKQGAGQVNRLRAVRDAGRLTLYANGTQLTSLNTPTLASAGRAGLLAISGTTGGLVTRFDDFIVRAGAVPPLLRPPAELGGGALRARHRQR